MLPIMNWIKELDRPDPFTPSASIWTDPHIAKQMLAAHLSPDTDAASYKPETIAAICQHLPKAMGLKPGAAIVDLGCGPGLYAKELTGQVFSVTGIDQSENSIRYARELNAGRQADFVNASYLQPFGENCFDAAVMISKDYGVLSPERRKMLLSNINNALKPGGYFALDVHSLFDFVQRQKSAAPYWEAAESGFWRPHPHVALSKTYFYPDLSVSCDMHAVLDEEFTIYLVWQTYFCAETIRQEFEQNGFSVKALWGNLKGDPLEEESTVIGVLCRKE
jgi:SAM-dependent methyltransferase